MNGKGIMDISQQLIRHFRKYTDVPEKDVAHILTYFNKISIDKKENVQEAGQLCRYQYFVLKGCLRMFFINEKGNEQTLQFAIENWWIADQLSFFNQRETEFFIQAVEASELFRIEFQAQEDLLKMYPYMERYFRKIYQIAYGAAQHGMKFRSDFSGEDLYLHFVKGYPGFVNRIPQYLLASFLGITPEYLSEIKKKNNL
jgi:CRP-like cAMP-binding protein